MTGEHASDEQLQDYALDSTACTPAIRQHINGCAICQANVAAYAQLIMAIEEQPLPMPHFDTAELVLGRLEKRRTWYIYLIVAANIIPAGIAVYLFRQSLTQLFNGISILFISLAAVTAICILIAVVIDQLSSYRNACNKINTSPSHQL